MMIVVIAATNPSSENRIMNASSRTTNKMEFVYRVARFGFLLALGVLALSALFATGAPVKTDNRSNPNAVATDTTSLKPPDKGQIPVAFLISDGAVVIDFCGPWEVFQDVMIPGSEEMPFRLYTVAETKKPIRTSGGMQIIPDYTIQNAPTPKVMLSPTRRMRNVPEGLGIAGSLSRKPIELVVSAVQNSEPSVKRTTERGANTTPTSGEKVAGHVIMLFGNWPVLRAHSPL